MDVRIFLLTLLLIPAIFISGCTQTPAGGWVWGDNGQGGYITTPNKPYLLSVNANPNFAKAGDKIRLEIQTSNPLSVPVITQLEFQIDKDCFYVEYFNASTQINSTGTIPQIVTVDVGNTYIGIPQLPDKCIGTQNIFVLLKDSVGNVLDYRVIPINLAKG